MDDGVGTWEPWPLAHAVERHRAAPFRWWVCGGHALELHTGRSWRDHDDVDVAVLRTDARAVRAFHGDLDIHLASRGVLTPWTGAPLSRAAHHNNLWCREGAHGPWRLDLTVSDGDDDAWTYRRDPSLRVPWDRAVLTTAEGIPYLAPELQLLHKSAAPRPKDARDAAEVLPALPPDRLSWLQRHLPPGHAWRDQLPG